MGNEQTPLTKGDVEAKAMVNFLKTRNSAKLTSSVSSVSTQSSVFSVEKVNYLPFRSGNKSFSQLSLKWPSSLNGHNSQKI